MSLIDLRATAFKAAAQVYPGASPYIYPARTTPGHWDIQCDVHWYLTNSNTLALASFRIDMCMTTHIPIMYGRKGILPHCNHSTRCSQFLIIQLQSASIKYTCLY